MPFAGGRYRFTRSMVEGAPADPGVYAVLIGLSAINSDDHEQLRHGMVLCDALHAWCAKARGETHTWNPQRSA